MLIGTFLFHKLGVIMEASVKSFVIKLLKGSLQDTQTDLLIANDLASWYWKKCDPLNPLTSVYFKAHNKNRNAAKKLKADAAKIRQALKDLKMSKSK